VPVRYRWNTTCTSQLSLWLAWDDNAGNHAADWDFEKDTWFCFNCGIDLEQVIENWDEHPGEDPES
jgi:hypothetical protein